MSFVARTKQALNVWLNRQSGRAVTVHPDDTFIVSYPKSGNTWVRFLIANLIHDDQKTTFANLEQRVPDIYQNVNRVLLARQRPRVLKSHEYFDPRYSKVLYVVRDPRDVLISYYHHHRKFRLIPDGISVEAFAPGFLNGSLDPFGSWGDNVGSWLGARRDTENFLLQRYEDLQSDAPECMARIAAFLGLKRSAESIQRIVQSCSLDRMKALEQQGGGEWKPLKETRRDIPFVRSGKTGEWRTSLPAPIVSEIEKRWRSQMIAAGYLSA